ncbi:GYD domain-containing protein [Ginsengibacter hankyongi]|uniref:GYD domain-containing protein n=1 Tax=Ginsengibacter hankyongi TaxID=2607284 RepID=A0A5J5IBK0_9BACT|nr:GYD domain-containing protein [Ginsengibacter hankyongi]KAA9035842.1 GYD domain-containing protein [Ginsengibacter hankyongi]
MTKFLITAAYNEDGVKGLLKVGGTNRKEAIAKMIADIGGKLEAFYFAFGDYDVYAIAELPDTTSAAALALTINASGMVNLSTTLLLTPEEIDKAAKMTVNYRSPGN